MSDGVCNVCSVPVEACKCCFRHPPIGQVLPLEQVLWRNGVMRSSNREVAEALRQLHLYPEPEFVVREAARRLERIKEGTC